MGPRTKSSTSDDRRALPRRLRNYSCHANCYRLIRKPARRPAPPHPHSGQIPANANLPSFSPRAHCESNLCNFLRPCGASGDAEYGHHRHLAVVHATRTAERRSTQVCPTGMKAGFSFKEIPGGFSRGYSQDAWSLEPQHLAHDALVAQSAELIDARSPEYGCASWYTTPIRAPHLAKSKSRPVLPSETRGATRQGPCIAARPIALAIRCPYAEDCVAR